MTRYSKWLQEKHNLKFDNYDNLYNWSVTEIESFWSSIWNFSEIIYSSPYKNVLAKRVMPGAKWFDGAKLNFAENLLRYRDDRIAITHLREGTSTENITFHELYRKVAHCAAGMRQLGVKKGDRVAGFLPNIPQTVIAMLAVTSIGAIWSSCSPDFGLQGLIDRFGQIKPKILITIDGYTYNGKKVILLDKITEIRNQISEIDKVIVIELLGIDDTLNDDKTLSFNQLCDNISEDIEFEQLPFNHPVYIMYSSGTTGVPKCIVHGAGGVLLQHYKEHVLHTNLTRDSVLFYFTTCGWMMWNWLVSGLQIGCNIFLYDGSPAYPSIELLWQMIEKKRITHFGTSPKFLTICQQRELIPKDKFDLSSLKTILSTGSPLTTDNYNYVYRSIKKNLQLASISGGTDILSCFMLGNPNLPVYSEEIQCRGLGMKVEAFNEKGESVTDEVGELVCTEPAPSMPVGFFNDHDNQRYHAAYFEHYPGIWRHGDYIKITQRGGVIVYGRSDSTLNPGGVRIGTAEIYNPVEAMDEIEDSVVIGQKWKGDIRVVLFVQLVDSLTLTDDLRTEIRSVIRKKTTPRHVPALILQVNDIPRTINWKKVEIAVSKVVHGENVTNREALANPESLDQFKKFDELVG